MMEAGEMKHVVRSMLGRLVTRLQNYGAQHQAALRKQKLASLARIDPTALVGDVAQFANDRGNPDHITIGEKCAILGSFSVFAQGGEITIGPKSFVGPGARIWSWASVKIGSYVLISHNVNIHDSISHSLSWRERREEIDRILPDLNLYAHPYDLQARPIVIEDDVWIGFGASIIGGVRIGRGAIIGAGTMVTKDVPPFTLVVGNPMRVVRQLSEDLACS